MAETLPRITLVRHGETSWSITGQHTGRTDILLTANGELDAQKVGQRLRRETFPHVLTSPLSRARRTCELAGFGAEAQPCDDLLEWNYGDYEGLTSRQIRERHPGWQLFWDGCPNGETPNQVRERLENLVTRLRKLDADVLIFAHGHILRCLTSVWLGQGLELGRMLGILPASVSILGYDHNPDEPVIQLWNDTSHLRATST